VPQEAFIGIIYAAASAAAILILSKSATGGEELKHMLVGDLLLVSFRSVMSMALLYGSIGVFHVIFRRRFLAISLNPEAAEASGMNIRLWDILFYMSFGVVIVKSVAIVGVLLVFSYLVVPAVIAEMWETTVRGKLLLGWLMAILASSAGIVWSFYFDYPTGPAVVVMLSLFLVVSSIAYYVYNAPAKGRATASVAVLLSCAIIFFSGLSLFKKGEPGTLASKLTPIDVLLNETKKEEESAQLDAVTHLGDMHDPRIVPALTALLFRTTSEQVVEVIAEALGKQRDPRAIPSLRHAAQQKYDDFLKYSIARSQLALDDSQGFETLIAILKDDEGGFARHQANELLETKAGRKFGYHPDQSVATNRAALEKIEAWWRIERARMK
jgi:hypothetical protein